MPKKRQLSLPNRQGCYAPSLSSYPEAKGIPTREVNNETPSCGHMVIWPNITLSLKCL